MIVSIERIDGVDDPGLVVPSLDRSLEGVRSWLLASSSFKVSIEVTQSKAELCVEPGPEEDPRVFAWTVTAAHDDNLLEEEEHRLLRVGERVLLAVALARPHLGENAPAEELDIGHVLERPDGP
jgi:hypothetical protein